MGAKPLSQFSEPHLWLAYPGIQGRISARSLVLSFKEAKLSEPSPWRQVRHDCQCNRGANGGVVDLEMCSSRFVII